MKKKLTLLLLILAITGIVTWYLEGIHGDGIIRTEDRVVPEFSKVTISGAYKIQWSHGSPALSITTDQNLLPHITTTVSDGTLRIGSKKNLHPTRDATITITSDSLADVQLTGANTFKASQLTGPELKVRATGASTIHVDGSVTKLDAGLTGASTLHAQSLQTQTATVSITGASHADVNATDALKASITGAGTITYSGNPKKVEKTVTGVGTIRSRP
jgi:hypothetical protein